MTVEVTTGDWPGVVRPAHRGGGGEAAGDTFVVDSQNLGERLDGELERSLVAEATFEGKRYELNCGSPISFGALRIDDNHPIAFGGRDGHWSAGRRFGSPYLVRKMNVVLGVSNAILVYEHGGRKAITDVSSWR